jgi:hypothetical protein
VGTGGAERQQRNDDGEGELPHKCQSITRPRAVRSNNPHSIWTDGFTVIG